MDDSHRRTILMKHSRSILGIAAGVIITAVLSFGTIRNPEFWMTTNRQGDTLLKKGNFNAAAKVYTDPLHLGIAQYRNGDFDAAARTFARVPGSTGAYNAANAWFMRGQYDQAISNYDRALKFNPNLTAARDNKQLAIDRRDAMKAGGADQEQESTDTGRPDQIAMDGTSKKPTEKPMIAPTISDEQLQATWLRRVTTTPADFLKAKFSWQAQTLRMK